VFCWINDRTGNKNIMKVKIWTVGAVLAMTLAACEDSGRDPISGQECSADDPVRKLRVPDCVAVPIGGQN
jgi:hypothetical protein